MKRRIKCAQVLLIALGVGGILSEVPAGAATSQGRYQLERAQGGFVRLDTVTGDMSFCSVTEGQLACRSAVKGSTQRHAEIAALAKDDPELIWWLHDGLAARPLAASMAPPPAQVPSVAKQARRLLIELADRAIGAVRTAVAKAETRSPSGRSKPN